MLEWVAEANAMLNHVVWGPAGLTLLLGTGLWLTVRMEGLQFRRAGYCLRHTAGEAFCSRRTPRQDQGAITQFQSMCTALAGTLGTGNIVGVATAHPQRRAGAVFWMWVMALLGMMTSFAENLLGVYYRRRSAKGEWIGGPMYYLRDGLGAKPGFRVLGRVLAGLFALFCVLASFGIGNMSQTNSIAGNLEAAFGVPPWVSGGVLAVLTGLILAGGWAGGGSHRKTGARHGLVLFDGGGGDPGCLFPGGAGGAARDLCGGFWTGSGWRRCGRVWHGTGCSLGAAAGRFFQRGRAGLCGNGERLCGYRRAGAAGDVGDL